MSGKALAAGSTFRAMPAASAVPLTSILDTYFLSERKGPGEDDVGGIP